MTGEWVGYHDNGQKSYRGRFVDGKQDGPFTYWYPNGQKMSEGEFKAGLRQGPWQAWKQDGTPNDAVAGNYVDGKKKE
jgi:antitoxin component YwqK of YwqJK toxin-antitoxin module